MNLELPTLEETSREALHTPESYSRRARQMRKQDYTALKFDVDVPNPLTPSN